MSENIVVMSENIVVTSLEQVYHRSSHHRDAIQPTTPLGCFCCLNQFCLADYSSDKLHWEDNRTTLCCPDCGDDCIVYGSDAIPYLKDLKRTYLETPAKMK